MKRLFVIAVLVMGCGAGDDDPHQLSEIHDGNTGELVGYQEAGCREDMIAGATCASAFSDRTQMTYEDCSYVTEVDGQLGCCVDGGPATAPDGLPVLSVWAECDAP
jgi:hypothetical protein